jgi:hypothetical protein
MKWLALCVVAAFFVLMVAPPSAPAYAQSSHATGKGGHDSTAGGKPEKTGSTSKKQ